MRQEVKSIEDAPLKITHKFQATDRILTKMISSFPRTPRSFLREINLPHNLVVSDLAICSMSLYLCTIQLHGSTAAHDEDSRSKMLSAASDIVAVAQGLHKIPEIYWPMGITMGWGNACEVFHREILWIVNEANANGPTSSDMITIDKILGDMEFLVKITKAYIKVYRNHERDVETIEELWKDAADIVKECKLDLVPAGPELYGLVKTQARYAPHAIRSLVRALNSE